MQSKTPASRDNDRAAGNRSGLPVWIVEIVANDVFWLRAQLAVQTWDVRVFFMLFVPKLTMVNTRRACLLLVSSNTNRTVHNLLWLSEIVVLPNAKCIGFAALASWAVSSCAIITTGTDQGIHVVTERNVSGASCTLVDSKGNRSFIPRTPGTTYMTRGNAPLIITCTKPGYRSATVEIGEKIAGATMGNVILGGGIGIIFDASSGAAQRYPDKVVIWMEPEDWPDESARLQWEEEKRAYIQQSISVEPDNTVHESGDDL